VQDGVVGTDAPERQHADAGRELVARVVAVDLGIDPLQVREARAVGEDGHAEAGGAAHVVAAGQHRALHVVADPAGSLALGEDRIERRAGVREQVGADVDAEVGVTRLPVQDAGDHLLHARKPMV
jgi:hypothetical protein